jgi:hypothetical protein
MRCHKQLASPLACQKLHMPLASPPAYPNRRTLFRKRKQSLPEPSLSIQISLKVP